MTIDTSKLKRSFRHGVAPLASLLIAGNVIAQVSTATVDSGGGRNASASYVSDGSIGGVVGISSVGADTAKHGYIGQLTDVSSVSLTGTPATVNETSPSQLTGAATLDDATVTALSGADVSWNPAIYPIASITGSGLATASVVYSNITGAFTGKYLGVTGAGSLRVLDSIPDNYGTYAGDGLPDWWQNQFFGLGNGNAGPGVDLDGDGQNNQFEYVAGLDPTNALSKFVLQILPITGQPNQKNLLFNPIAAGRLYTVQFNTNLVTTTFTNLLTASTPVTNANEVTVTDLSAVESKKFYRVNITLP